MAVTEEEEKKYKGCIERFEKDWEEDSLGKEIDKEYENLII